MHRKTQEKRKKSGAVFCFLTFLMLLMTLFAWGIGAHLGANLETSLPETYLQGRTQGGSPRFFVCDFSDRANRTGELREVTAAIYAQKKQTYVPLSEIPQALEDAFIAIEDKHFWEHTGVDWMRTIFASANYLLGFSDTFGASTITQQLVKNLTGRNEITPQRKLQEMLYARDMERRMAKSEILELYLNVIHFSDRCDGIAAAAQHYFSKEPQALSLSECATVAAITNNPSYYNPIRHPENNLRRRNLILSEMCAQGYISQDACREAREAPLGLCVDATVGREGVNSWYTDMVIEDVIADLMGEYGMSRAAASRMLYSGGLRIDLAMDERLQRVAEEYYAKELTLPEGNGGMAESALILLDNRTGDVLAAVGAVGEKRGNRLQNFATQTKRAPGSTIKPLTVYAPALEAGVIDWSSVYDDVPTDFFGSEKTPWPKNATRSYRGLTDIPYAVAHSTNTVAVRILRELGKERAFCFATEKLHLPLCDNRERGDCEAAALALGQLQYGVTLRDLSTAYTPLADAGSYHPWRTYYRVVNEKGEILLSCPDASEQVLSEENAAIMTKLLEGVITHGSASEIRLQSVVDCAGKTGSSGEEKDRWFIGYTPDIICGVWCGYPYPEPLEGKSPALSIWDTVMHRILVQTERRQCFALPDTLVCASYCKDSGMLPTEACKADPRGGRMENGWFVRGREPSAFCECHVLCEYDSLAGGISHGGCPHSDCETVGLLKIKRHFPVRIRVSDAQYTYVEDPLSTEPNADPDRAYFDREGDGRSGLSRLRTPFNRSCPAHAKTPPAHTSGVE